jgi:ADP-ribosylglycohydrolase
MTTPLDRAQGCLLGQLGGDSLGGLVEFTSPLNIRFDYPNGPRLLKNGGTWDLLAGQPTDDSEMALMLARTLVRERAYDVQAVREAYLWWLASHPFDVGNTVLAGLNGQPNPNSQSNGSLMRISPLGIFGANQPVNRVAEWALLDASITHVHPVCGQAAALYSMAVAHAVRSGCTPAALYAQVLAWAREMPLEEGLRTALLTAADAPPADYVTNMGWVLIGFGNAFWQLLHAPNLEEGVVDTVRRGGDTDTNAAIAGALMGAVYGREAVPEQWVQAILNCHPTKEQPEVVHPRPPELWPVDALELAAALLTAAG